MKSQLLEKLPVFIILFFFFSAAKTQIVYTDVKPDSVIIKYHVRGQYNLDLNNDGITDFIFSYKYEFNRCGGEGAANKMSEYIKMPSGSNNQVLIANSSLAFDSSFLINPNGQWSVDTSLILLIVVNAQGFCLWGNNHFGAWYNVSDKYFGLKFMKDGNTYYGWARLTSLGTSLTNFNEYSLTLKDYAYNSIPNQPIRAGEKSCTTPTATLKANGPLSFCNGDSIKFTANGSGYLYQWKKNGVNISGATSQTYTAKTAGTYKCFVTNSCGSITSTGKKVTVTCKGLFISTEISHEKIISQATHLKIAPNPFSNSTAISFSLPQSQKISIRVYDMTGRLIKILADAEMQAGPYQLVWNALDEKGSAVSTGIYFLRMQTGSYAEIKKLVVVK